MKLYYRAVTQDGKSVSGIIDAQNSREVANYLRKHKLFPIKILPATETGVKHYLSFLKRSSDTSIIFFTRQLSSMLTAGLTLLQALLILKNQIPSRVMTEAMNVIVADLEDGKSFSSAIEKYPNIFSPTYVSLIRTAESSGLLDKILLRLADNLEKHEDLERKIKGALIYPIIIVVMMIIVVVIMMVVVIPQLNVLYAEVGTTLPVSTSIIIWLSKFLTNFWYIIVIVIFLSTLYFRNWYRRPTGRKMVDTYTLRLPIVGKLLRESMMAEFTRTLGLLINSGSLVVASLLRSSEVVGNVLYKEAIVLVAKKVEKGISMGDAMESSPLFPNMVVEMVKIGEQTGKLDESLIRASEYFERNVEDTIKVLTTLFEPLIMAILALGVGFLIFAVITPIYNLITSF